MSFSMFKNFIFYAKDNTSIQLIIFNNFHVNDEICEVEKKSFKKKRNTIKILNAQPASIEKITTFYDLCTMYTDGVFSFRES